MTRDNFIAWISQRPGFARDGWGNYVRVDPTTGRKVRYKINKLAVRREVWGPENKMWIRVRSGYYRTLTITPEGKLAGLKR